MSEAPDADRTRAHGSFVSTRPPADSLFVELRANDATTQANHRVPQTGRDRTRTLRRARTWQTASSPTIDTRRVWTPPTPPTPPSLPLRQSCRRLRPWTARTREGQLHLLRGRGSRCFLPPNRRCHPSADTTTLQASALALDTRRIPQPVATLTPRLLLAHAHPSARRDSPVCWTSGRTDQWPPHLPTLSPHHTLIYNSAPGTPRQTNRMSHPWPWHPSSPDHFKVEANPSISPERRMSTTTSHPSLLRLSTRPTPTTHPPQTGRHPDREQRSPEASVQCRTLGYRDASGPRPSIRTFVDRWRALPHLPLPLSSLRRAAGVGTVQEPDAP